MSNNPIQTVWDIAEKATKAPTHVLIDIRRIEDFVKTVTYDPKVADHSGTPIPQNPGGDKKLVYYELLASAVNYMYWYGSSEIRPNNAGAGEMYRLLTESFQENDGDWYSDNVCNIFARKMIESRFPYSEVRYKQLRSFRGNRMTHSQWSFITEVASQGGKEPVKKPMHEWVSGLITRFPNFGQDIFLKRAFLFFGMLNRRYGWFADEMKDLPMPADYQIPKVLRSERILKYRRPLELMIDNHDLIPAGSLMEVEIRASTLIACRTLAERLNWTMMEVDDFFFCNRKKYSDPFHLTITTDY